MLRKIAVLAAAALAAMAFASVAVAQGKGNSHNAIAAAKCVQEGVGTLVSLGLIDEAARGKIDYSALADPVNGPIFAELPAGSFIPLRDVIALHRSSPELFAWCR